MAALTNRLPDGVHINLPDVDYFGQDALGSSDLVTLHFKKLGWRQTSRHNPRHKDKTTKEKLFGSALHALLLEGQDAYEARFCALPDKTRIKGLITTNDEKEAKLIEEGFALPRPKPNRSEQWNRLMRANLPDVPVWENIVADFDDERGIKIALPAEDDEAVRFMRDVALDPDRSDNEDVRKLFTGAGDYPVLAEVSVFWVEGGVRRRARLDRMFPAFDMDLKTLGGWSGRPLDYETGDILAKRGMDIQRADHFKARHMIYDYVNRLGEKAIFGGSPEQRRAIMDLPRIAQDFDYVWLFYQKPSDTGRAAVIFPVMDISHIRLPGGETRLSNLITWGTNKKLKALQLYRDAVAEFGLDRPWARVEHLHYASDDFQPHITLPSWIAEDSPTGAAAYDQDEEPE